MISLVTPNSSNFSFIGIKITYFVSTPFLFYKIVIKSENLNPTIYDNHGRPITYLRLSVTDRCNLRCFYCMPEEGIQYLPKKSLLTYEEMERMVRVLVSLGINKMRITGGEPFVRKDLVDFLEAIHSIPDLQQINITTNGVLVKEHLSKLKILGINAINLSLDTLDRERFFLITRRDDFTQVWETFHLLLDGGFKLKLNAVVMDGKNTEDILPMAKLTQTYPVDVRFIEEMPFNGEGSNYPTLKWTYTRILEEIKQVYPALQKLQDEKNGTAIHYRIPGSLGRIGIIPAFSRTFCGTCNRIRITAQGDLKTCLYDDGVLNVRDIMRAGASDIELKETFIRSFSHRPKDGFEAEARRLSGNPVKESMSTIGG